MLTRFASFHMHHDRNKYNSRCVRLQPLSSTTLFHPTWQKSKILITFLYKQVQCDEFHVWDSCCVFQNNFLTWSKNISSWVCLILHANRLDPLDNFNLQKQPESGAGKQLAVLHRMTIRTRLAFRPASRSYCGHRSYSSRLFCTSESQRRLYIYSSSIAPDAGCLEVFCSICTRHWRSLMQEEERRWMITWG